MSLIDHGRAGAAHRQARHHLLHEPALAAVGDVERRQLAVDGAHERQAAGDRRSREHFARHVRPPLLRCRRPRSAPRPRHCSTRGRRPRRRWPARRRAGAWSWCATGACPSPRRRQRPCRRGRRRRSAPPSDAGCSARRRILTVVAEARRSRPSSSDRRLEVGQFGRRIGVLVAAEEAAAAGGQHQRQQQAGSGGGRDSGIRAPAWLPEAAADR